MQVTEGRSGVMQISEDGEAEGKRFPITGKRVEEEGMGEIVIR